jgi:hypothetical protein
VGGPWFAVLESNAQWKPFTTLWLGNGENAGKAQVEIQLRLEERTNE